MTDESKTRLMAKYPHGIRFEPMGLRLLGLEPGQVEVLKLEMFQKADGCWLFPEQVADEETWYRIQGQTVDWLGRHDFFAVEALFVLFAESLREVHSVEDFSAFLLKLGPWRGITVTRGYCFKSVRPLEDCLRKNAQIVAEMLERAGGELAQTDVLEKMPHLDRAAVTDLLKRYAPDVHEMEIGGIPCWRLVDAVHLPDDFSEAVSSAVDKLIELGFDATLKNLEMILSVRYGFRFLDEYNLTEELFQKVLSKHYLGGRAVRWKYNRVVWDDGAESGVRRKKKLAEVENDRATALNKKAVPALVRIGTSGAEMENDRATALNTLLGEKTPLDVLDMTVPKVALLRIGTSGAARSAAGSGSGSPGCGEDIPVAKVDGHYEDDKNR